MPLYNFRNKSTGEISEQRMKIAEMEQFLSENPDMEITHLEAPPIGDSHRMGLVKAPAGFRDLVSNIKKKHLRSTINER